MTALFARWRKHQGSDICLLRLWPLYLSVRGRFQTLSFISPLGWRRTDVFVGNQWWPVFCHQLQLLFYPVSFYLNSVRDLDAGFIPAGKGGNMPPPFCRPVWFYFKVQSVNIAAWGSVFSYQPLWRGMGDLELFSIWNCCSFFLARPGLFDG
ncbi:MAG: hypothetical protein RJR35_05820 [Thermoanaerobacterales bacterium]|nr:hypothetical protein [Thermoanaerobacterales bacterium]